MLLLPCQPLPKPLLPCLPPGLTMVSPGRGKGCDGLGSTVVRFVLTGRRALYVLGMIVPTRGDLIKGVRSRGVTGATRVTLDAPGRQLEPGRRLALAPGPPDRLPNPYSEGFAFRTWMKLPPLDRRGTLTARVAEPAA